MTASRTLGINGLGRIGKLTLWYHLAHDSFDRIVINMGRPVGTSLASLAEYIAKDSTYGPLHRYLGGCKASPDVTVLDEAKGLLRAHGKELLILREARNPKDIPWRDNGVSVVVDCTGKFQDPHADADDPKGSLRGHLAAGARAVVQSSPFKSKGEGAALPDDSAFLIYGINHLGLRPRQAQAGLGGLVHHDGAGPHDEAPTGQGSHQPHDHGRDEHRPRRDGQPACHRLGAASGAKDLRKTRGAMGNIVLTSTNAAKALEQVMPEIANIGFMADSVRIPTVTASLVILNVTFQTEMLADGSVSVDREAINAIYEEASKGEARGLVKYSEEQNVSTDMIGEDAAVVIEAVETHTRTGFVDLQLSGGVERIPMTHVKVFGWYDNELGSYTHRLGQLTGHVGSSL